MPKTNQLSDWLAWLETLHPSEIELGVDRIRIVADRLHILSRLQSSNIKIITIAGTNGKGSTVATLQALFLASNQTVASYTSPHLLRFNERIVVNGKEADDDSIVNAMQEIEAVRAEVSLSYFEYTTLAAWLVFLQAGVEYWVLEVGLGGRLDAVNLLDADVAVITQIDLDHQDWLGNDREVIGREKAGIMRRDRPAICVDSDMPNSIAQHAQETGAKLLSTPQHLNWRIQKQQWQWTGVNGENAIDLTQLPMPSLPLPSVAAALQAFVLLGQTLEEEWLRKLLPDLRLPGRCQRLHVEQRQVLLDVAHNPAAAQYLANWLQATHGEKCHLVFAAMADKDIEGMVSILDPQVDWWYFAGNPKIARSARKEVYSGIAEDMALSATVFPTVVDALQAALARSENNTWVVVCGSFYTVAEALQWSGSKTENPN